MVCPQCGSEMFMGCLELKRSKITFNIKPSSADLVFTSPGYEDFPLLAGSDKNEGYFCLSCHTCVMLPYAAGEKPEPDVVI